VLKFISARLIQAAVTIWALATVVFFLGRLGTDPVLQLLPQDATREQIAQLRHQLGLDRSVLVQYWHYLLHLAHGDLGRSYVSQMPVSKVLGTPIINSMELTFAAIGLALAIAIPTGVISALWRGSLLDRIFLNLGVLGQAVPPFWLALILVLIFSVNWGLLPVAGKGGFLHFVLPSVTLGAFMMAGLYRLMRSGMLEVLSADYVKFARIKGLGERRVVIVHALRNALAVPLTYTTIYVGLLLGGTVIIETIFNWPGIGLLAYQAVIARDLPVIEAVVLVASASVIVANLLADLLYLAIDPRIAY
jgi:peptide/nickel transport system permease protein